jgi:hypothetical protein
MLFLDSFQKRSMEAAVSVSLGVVRFLPAKFERLLSPATDHGRLHTKEKDKIRLLRDRLQELMDKLFLMDPSSSSELEAPTSSSSAAAVARCWAKEVRELSYDIDDFLDSFTHRLHGTAADDNRGKIARFREGLSRSRWVAGETSRFRARLEGAIQRHKRYNLDKLQRRPVPTVDSDEPQIPLLYRGGGAHRRLFGIDSSMEKLQEWLLAGDGGQRLRVVSVVGPGGIGKTTLAKELYCKLGRRFDCRAFARSSQKPDMRGLLTSILLQIRRHRAPDDDLESDSLIDTIRAHLRHKK